MDLQDRVFGRLKVIGSFKKDGYYYCDCVCECGNKVAINKYSLLKGLTKSCGCYNKEKLQERRQDLTGKTFGKWKVLEYVGNSIYKCQCSCEKHTISLISTQSLKSGHSTCCGCNQHEKRQNRLNQYIGKQFGDFTVESMVGCDDKRRAFFNIKCKNGHIRRVRDDNLHKVSTCKECLKKPKKEKRVPHVVNVGDRFGKLTVISIYKNDKDNKRTICKCRCDCGEEFEVYKGGIYKRMSCGKCRKEDLTGKTFGRWYVDSYDKLLDRWKCICSCEEHNISYLTISDLKSGHSKSCGCYNKECIVDRFLKDISNKRFGKLTALFYDRNLRKWHCRCDCGNETNVSASNLSQGHVQSCGNCGFGSSFAEHSMKEYIKEIVPKAKMEKAKILNRKEIDIYLPEYKIGIEYNGSVFHASINNVYRDKPKNYHRDKFLLAKEKGIHLLNIFDVDWESNQEKIKMYLQDLLMTKNKLFARKCEIKYIDKDMAVEFVDKYHLQGSCSRYMNINIGLLYENELIALMSFGNLRMKAQKEGEFELHRYVVKPGYTIIGGANKIFSEFIKKFNPTYIRSYSDNDYFLGGIYEKLGFEDKGQVTPRYYWLYKDKELKREECMLKRLKNLYPELYKESIDLQAKNKEDYIMTKLGAKKIYRSGNTKWEWNKP